uniref:Putative secreted protein n=1 Tax=Anopheles triannulatus TaxID=58253 RepID=A0A2M4B6I2_9DIPT
MTVAGVGQPSASSLPLSLSLSLRISLGFAFCLEHCVQRFQRFQPNQTTGGDGWKPGEPGVRSETAEDLINLRDKLRFGKPQHQQHCQFGAAIFKSER